MKGTTLNGLHGRLIRDTFGDGLNDLDAFLVFVLLHDCRIVLSGPVLTDDRAARGVEGLTQRGASRALASAWAGTQDERADWDFWYRRWNGEWGSYGHAERLPPEEKKRLEQLRAELERHPFVSRLEPEDDLVGW